MSLTEKTVRRHESLLKSSTLAYLRRRPPHVPDSSRTRLFSLDALRGIAVFLMIEQHVGIWLWKGPERGKALLDYPLLVGFNALGGMAAPLFVTLAGVGSALYIATERPGTDRTLVRRGLVLMAFGLVLNLLTPSWFSWGSWFVLHMMGFAMALAPIWRRLPDRALLLACAVVLVAAVAVQEWLETPRVLQNVRMRDTSLPGGALRLAIAESQFPILPWLTFYLAGMIAGRAIVVGRLARIVALAIGFATLAGLGLLLRASGIIEHPFITRAFDLQLGFFPASIAIVGLLLGGALLLIAFVRWLEARRPMHSRHPLVTLGRSSLTLLMLHVVLFRELSRPVGLWRGLSATPALMVVIGFVVLATVLSRVWSRIDFRYGAEWLLRRIAG